jgi:hypothetical protein
MKRFAAIALALTLFAPTQIVLAYEFPEETEELTYQTRGKMAEVQLHMGQCAVLLNRMVKPGSNVSVAKLQEIKKLLDEIDRLTLQLQELGGG